MTTKFFEDKDWSVPFSLTNFNTNTKGDLILCIKDFTKPNIIFLIVIKRIAQGKLLPQVMFQSKEVCNQR